MRRVNLHRVELDDVSARDGYRWRRVRVGRAIGGEQIGASLFELGDGERTFPYHFHHGTEEWLLVVGGTPTLRSPEGERVLREGDVVCFPAGEAGAHAVTGPGSVLLLSAAASPDISEYPDSGKVGVRPQGANYRIRDGVDYWYGE
jgi:uncharacterized cupin superfamily protein